jgi:hypothetical protein
MKNIHIYKFHLYNLTTAIQECIIYFFKYENKYGD